MHRSEALASKDGLVRGRDLRVREARCEDGDCGFAALCCVGVVLNIFAG